MAQMVICKNCGREVPQLIEPGFAVDNFEHLDRHLCVTPSVKALLNDEPPKGKVSAA